MSLESTHLSPKDARWSTSLRAWPQQRSAKVQIPAALKCGINGRTGASSVGECSRSAGRTYRGNACSWGSRVTTSVTLIRTSCPLKRIHRCVGRAGLVQVSSDDVLMTATVRNGMAPRWTIKSAWRPALPPGFFAPCLPATFRSERAGSTSSNGTAGASSPARRGRASSSGRAPAEAGTAPFPAIAGAIAALPVKSLIIDGEAVMLRPDFDDEVRSPTVACGPRVKRLGGCFALRPAPRRRQVSPLSIRTTARWSAALPRGCCVADQAQSALVYNRVGRCTDSRGK